MNKDDVQKLAAAARKVRSNYLITGVQQYAAILKETKPSVYLLHGYYPGGRNNPCPE